LVSSTSPIEGSLPLRGGNVVCSGAGLDASSTFFNEMGKRVTRLIDGIFDEMHWELVNLGFRKSDASSAWDFFILFFALNLTLCILPMLSYLTVSQSPHVVFWLGREPQDANLLVPVVLLILVAAMPCVKCLQASQGSTRVIVFLLFFTGGLIMVAGGLHVMTAAHNVSLGLTYHCGTPGAMSERMESEWRRLDAFRRTCLFQSGSHSITRVQQCPGYVGMLVAPHDDFVTYLEAVETDFGCSGFCRFWAQPLFAVETEAGQRCASAVGQEVVNSGYLVGLPTIASGAVLLGLGGCLACYDHL